VPVLGKEDLLTVNSVQQILLKIEYSFLRISSREIFSKTTPGFLIGRRPGRVCTRKGFSTTEFVEVTIADTDASNGCLLCELRGFMDLQIRTGRFR
jgi:hypothetical protein